MTAIVHSEREAVKHVAQIDAVDPKDYINAPTRELTAAIRGIVQENAPLAGDKAVREAWAAFDASCKAEPAIVDFLRRKCAAAPGTPLVTRHQFELIMLSVIARSSSTYGTIPSVVAHLALVGEHADAATLNENAKNETGDKTHISHATLLFTGMRVLGESLKTNFLTPASYHIARQILLTREKDGHLSLTNVEAVIQYLDEQNIYVPSISTEEIKRALYFADLADARITGLHSVVLQTETGLDDRAATLIARNPYDKKWLAVRLLELAMREASSVDERSSGKLSYIGAWGLLVESLLGHLPADRRADAVAWIQAHNDEEAGQAVGWAGAAEEGHAEDARLQATKMMRRLCPTSFAKTLQEVTKLNELRLQFWEEIWQD